MAKRIDSYVPKMDPSYWVVIEDFVRCAIEDAKPDRWSTARPWMSTLAGLTLWCWQTAGLELKREVVLDPTTISRYVNAHDNWTQGSRGTTRSVLLRLSDRLIGPQSVGGEHRRYKNAKGSAPYTKAEEVQLRSFANGQATEYRRLNVSLLLALGAGAGLAAQEALKVRREDILISPAGVKIAVRGSRPRQVAMLRGWEDLVHSNIDKISEDDVLLASRNHRTKAAIADFLFTCNGQGLRPSSQRLRSTWIVTHLNLGTPLPLLVEAAGISTIHSLGRYLEYINPVDPALADDLLRGDA